MNESRLTITMARGEKLLLRSTNWIGDAIMTLPAINSLRQRFPDAEIAILAKEWVADIFRLSPSVDRVLILDEERRHRGISGKLALAQELRHEGFAAAILLQNAISAAIIATLARIPVRAGYNTDARGLLLTHSVRLPRGIKKEHQSRYYLEMVKALGCPEVSLEVSLRLPAAYRLLADDLLGRHGIGEDKPLIGIAPSAAYGPAKRWLPERFAAVAAMLEERFGATILLFGSADDGEVTANVSRLSAAKCIDLAGKTNLQEAIAAMSRCRLFIANDSGLMHVAGALNLPLVAIFGSTNHVTTSPLGAHSVIVRHPSSCSPCLKKECDRDFRCMKSVTVDEVFDVACRLWWEE